jgi:hypothetical protein
VDTQWRRRKGGTQGVRRRVGASLCPMHIWTVDTPTAARRLWGVAGMVTNAPAGIRAACDAF